MLGREFYDRLADFAPLRRCGRRLDGAVQAYNSAAASFETRVLAARAQAARSWSVTTAPELPVGRADRDVPRVLKQAGLLEVPEEADVEPENHRKIEEVDAGSQPRDAVPLIHPRNHPRRSKGPPPRRPRPHPISAEPNGYLHIGHAKSIGLNFGVAAEFNGLCNLRNAMNSATNCINAPNSAQLLIGQGAAAFAAAVPSIFVIPKVALST